MQRAASQDAALFASAIASIFIFKLADDVPHRGSAALRQPDARGYRDTWSLRHPGVHHAPSVCVHGDNASPFTFGYIFASANLAAHIREVRLASELPGPDHQRLLIELA